MIKCSRFNVPFTHGARRAVWNSRTDLITELSEREYAGLRRGEAESLAPERRELLLERGVLTQEAEELESFLRLRQEQRQLRTPYFRILTTTRCNARCAYCYERGFPQQSMDEDTAAAAAEFITEKYMAHPRRSPVTIEWFGGEPCLNLLPADIVSERLRQRDIPFRARMTTNGLLLTEDFVRRAGERNIKALQISLDAAEGEYEEIKGLPKGSFRRVLENAERCLSAGIKLTLRLNYAGSMERGAELIRTLGRSFAGAAKKPAVYISPLYDGARSIPRETMLEVLELERQLSEAGLTDTGRLYSLRERDRCFAATPWGYTLMPDGRLINCSHNSSAENSFGWLGCPEENAPSRRKFLSDELTEDCGVCPLLPVCGGGCPAAQHGLAEMDLCIPYKNVLPDILRLRAEKELDI